MKDIGNHWGKVLQAVAHWIAYKKQYFDGHLLVEGAIVGELSQLLSAKLKNGLALKLEMHYSDIDSAITDGSRCDIAIGKFVKGIFQVEEVVEVKRFEVDKKANNIGGIEEDFIKLNRLNNTNPRPRLIQVVVGQRTLPKEYFGNGKKDSQKNSNGMKTGNVSKNKSNAIVARPRMSRKALNTKGFGGYALLIEVNPEE